MNANRSGELSFCAVPSLVSSEEAASIRPTWVSNHQRRSVPSMQGRRFTGCCQNAASLPFVQPCRNDDKVEICYGKQSQLRKTGRLSAVPRSIQDGAPGLKKSLPHSEHAIAFAQRQGHSAGLLPRNRCANCQTVPLATDCSSVFSGLLVRLVSDWVLPLKNACSSIWRRSAGISSKAAHAAARVIFRSP